MPETLPAFDWIATHPWAYPALEVVHIVGIALLFGNLVSFELRLWGVGAALPLHALGRLSLSLSLGGFALAAASGVAMFASQPAEFLANPAFLVKLGLLMAAGANAAVYHARVGMASPDGPGRLQLMLSLVLWLSTIIAGRWIAYV
jgi:hypothetical protein